MEKNIIRTLMVALVIILAIAGVAVAQDSAISGSSQGSSGTPVTIVDSVGYSYYNTDGANAKRFVLSLGNTAVVDRVLFIKLNDIKYEEGGLNNAASLMITHALIDIAPGQTSDYVLREGRSVDLVDYTITLVRVGQSSVVMAVQKKGTPGTKNVDLGERFSLGTEEKAIVNNNLKVEMNGFLYAADIVGGSPVVKVTLYDYISDPRIMRFIRSPESFNLQVGGTADYLNYRLKFLSVENSKAVFVVTLKSDSDPVHVGIGQDFKATRGMQFIINNRIKMVVDEVYPIIYYDAAVVTDSAGPITVESAKITLYDYISDPRIMRPIMSPKSFSMGIGDKAEYLGYTVTLKEAHGDIRVFRADIIDFPYNTANFNEVFKMNKGQTFIVGGLLRMTLNTVVDDTGYDIARYPIVTATISYNYGQISDSGSAIRLLSFSSVGEVEEFGAYAVELVDIDKRSGRAAFKVRTKIDDGGIEVGKVEFGQGFKAKVKDKFNIAGIFDVEVLDIFYDPTTDRIPGAELKIVSRRPAITALPTNYYLLHEQTKILFGGYRVRLTDINEERIGLVFYDKDRPVILPLDNTLYVSDVGIEPFVVREIKIEPGASNYQIVASSGSSTSTGNSLEEGVYIDVPGKSSIRVKANAVRLETYLIQEDVTATTRGTLKSNVEGLFIGTDNDYVKLKILPKEASEKAQEVINAKFRTFELEEYGEGYVYVGNAKKEFRILGFIPASGTVYVTIDAETGQVLNTKKPWFAFFSTE